MTVIVPAGKTVELKLSDGSSHLVVGPAEFSTSSEVEAVKVTDQ